MFEDDLDESFEQDVTELIARYERLKEDHQQCFFEESSYEQIIDFYESKSEFSEALEVADLALGQYPFSATFLIKKAQLYFDIKQYDKALSLLDQAEVLDRKDLNLHLLRSDIYVWKSDFKRAAKTIIQALAWADKDERSDLHMELADIYEEWERYHEVFDSLIAALSENPFNEEALNRLWFCVEFTEKYEESIRFHRQYLDTHPFASLAWFNLAHAYAGLEMHEEAIEAFEYTLAIDEKNEFAYKDCADAFFQLGRYPEAIQYYEEAARIAKPYKELYFNIGECYELLKDHVKARHFFRKAIGLDSNFEEAYYRLGINYMAEGMHAPAIHALNRAHRLNHEEPDYVLELARCHKATDNIKEAIANYERMIQLKSLQIESWKEYADFLVEQRKFRDAVRVMDEALDFFGHQPEIYWQRALVFYQAGNKKEALLSLETSLLQGFEHASIQRLNLTMQDDPVVLDLLERYKGHLLH